MDKKPKILLVDDKPENLVALQVVLQDLEVDLVMATSGNDALRETLKHDFALALLDIQMPEMDGYELAGILREEEKTSRLPFIFISAVYTDNLNVFKGYERGAFSFITKPFQKEILINKVKFFIEKHQQEMQLVELNMSLEKKNEELQHMNKELEAFSYSVSHDLRSPLRAIAGYAHMLEEDFGSTLNEEGNRLIHNVRHYARQMGILIDELLTFSRLGRKDLQKEPLNMKQIVDIVVEDLSRINGRKVNVNMGQLENVSGDFALVRQVIFNLLSNAVKYSAKKENPQVKVWSDIHENEVWYHVEDNGAGFDMRYADKLFGVFQRLHSQDEFEGTGVGLAIVQRIVNRHGGKIWAEGAVDKGATFHFSLPKHV